VLLLIATYFQNEDLPQLKGPRKLVDLIFNTAAAAAAGESHCLQAYKSQLASYSTFSQQELFYAKTCT